MESSLAAMAEARARSKRASSALLLPSGKPFKRRRKCSTDSNQNNVRSLIVHRVHCSQSMPGHDRHDPKLYLDQPRLFAGDTKASALRGQECIQNSLEDYLAVQFDIGLVVLRTYECTVYATVIDDEFTLSHLPDADSETAAALRPYFYRLQDNPVEPAQPYDESIVLSSDTQSAMNELRAALPLLLSGWKANLQPPYLQIFHVRDRIRALAPEVLSEHHQALVLGLLDYVEDSFGAEYREADALFAQGMVTRGHMSKLFGPNEIIITTDGGEPTAYVSEVIPVWDRDEKLLRLRCYHWIFDGVFHQEQKTIIITWPATNEPIPITDLAAYPLRFDTTGQIEQHLRSRGNMFWSCRKRNLVASVAQSAPFQIRVSNPRYMIDTVTYHELHEKAASQRAENSTTRLSQELMDSETPPEGSFVLLLPPRILGFGMHDKKWRTLLVKDLRPPEWNKRAFRQLVLDPQKKELMEAMVKIHISSTMSTDVIEGKGNGLIILLHGGPGTGKTLTAESVAELAEKPLYRVTCGDIGTNPESVEQYLESVLYIGTTWKAVVLLDESDVFLEEREKTDLQRNALVSVFLRALEYYEGILILTSNRVGIFDEAFKSRVQLALHYPPLDYKGRWEIWNNFFSLLRRQQENKQSVADGFSNVTLADGESISQEELCDKIDVLAKEELNGRQIRNAITTARQLARFRGQPLGFAHLAQTIRIANEFEEYVEKTHGHKAGDYAKAAGMRLE
ncbi:hypothetical protein PFICI_13854 [Pestalotiopsis fici W106-1]|uniref:AAA+ ATPase domain-containing protein n=1 Tax=Pestalotiopsis fici (strain W106-1 / CGMCC3.15140) TaxID=1229662 RepID=W3WJD1_PESFW|nr:uncharacterized protein PFICI_13854 [Pestalotiopsis fici W106-1]ETS73988.1 hypothetical protein PFICI_13854 [Pestalotiopsis fici W106-1]